MSNFASSSIVVLYLYYNELVEECKGQKLSVLILFPLLHFPVECYYYYITGGSIVKDRLCPFYFNKRG